MALFAKDHNQIIQESLDFMQANTLITSTGPGSKFRALLEIMRYHLGEAYATFDMNVAMGFVYGASGKYLDYIASMFGLVRKNNSYAAVSAGAQVVKFYTQYSDFGKINNGANISVPSGTKIFGFDGEQEIDFYTVNSVVLTTSINELYVDVRAYLPGSTNNVNAGSLVYHDFRNYALVDDGSLLVTNTSTVSSGTNEESDDDFRYRIINARLERVQANETAIYLAALSVPGVADAIIYDQFYGPGTFSVYLISTMPMVSDELLSLVELAIKGVKASGIYFTVQAPKYIGFKCALSLVFNGAVSEQEKTTAKQNVQFALASHINNITNGGIYVNELVDIAIKAHPSIRSIGIPNKFFTSLTLVIPVTDSQSINKVLSGDYVTQPHEKVLVMSPSTDILVS